MSGRTLPRSRPSSSPGHARDLAPDLALRARRAHGAGGGVGIVLLACRGRGEEAAVAAPAWWMLVRRAAPPPDVSLTTRVPRRTVAAHAVHVWHRAVGRAGVRSEARVRAGAARQAVARGLAQVRVVLVCRQGGGGRGLVGSGPASRAGALQARPLQSRRQCSSLSAPAAHCVDAPFVQVEPVPLQGEGRQQSGALRCCHVAHNPAPSWPSTAKGSWAPPRRTRTRAGSPRRRRRRCTSRLGRRRQAWWACRTRAPGPARSPCRSRPARAVRQAARQMSTAAAAAGMRAPKPSPGPGAAQLSTQPAPCWRPSMCWPVSRLWWRAST